jgi:hypothetical protein
MTGTSPRVAQSWELRALLAALFSASLSTLPTVLSERLRSFYEPRVTSCAYGQ